jgi:hypothetical protein
MSTRLQVVVEDAELRRFRRAAKASGLTLSEWARQALRSAERLHSSDAPGPKLAAVRAAARHAFPAPDIDQMLEEIEQGYRGGDPA